jgi:putative transposase
VSRRLRFDHPGAIWHVYARGNNRERIYTDDADRLRWLAELETAACRNGWIVHAYVMMGNHYHLLIETPAAQLSRGMRHLNGVYAQAFNRRHGRVGHLFQDRFQSVLVERESQLLVLAAYVVLNPVRAHLVRRPDLWRWSSYRATAGLDARPAWLTTSWTLDNFGGSRERYVAFVRERAADKARIDLRRRPYLGSEAFVRAARAAAASLVTDEETPSRYRKAPPRPMADVLAELLRGLSLDERSIGLAGRLARERGLVAYGLRRHAGATGRVLGPLLGVSRGQGCALARAGEQCWPASGLLPA